MAFVWVQQWIALPIVLEDQMGDAPSGLPASAPPSQDESTAGGLVRDNPQSSAAYKYKTAPTASPFQPGSQLGALPQPSNRSHIPSPAHLAGPHHHAQEHHGANPLSMASMADALPEYPSIDPARHQLVQQQSAQVPQQPLSGASTPAVVYQLQQNLQIAGGPHAAGPYPPQQPAYAPAPYGQTFAPSHGTQPHYGSFPPNQRLPPASNTPHGSYPTFQQSSPYIYYPSPYAAQPQLPQTFHAQPAQHPALYAGRQLSSSNVPMPSLGHTMVPPQMDGGFAHGARFAPGAMPGGQTPGTAVLSGTLGAPGLSQPGPATSVPRGPPRKPKQSGHALWVGNLPPGTTVTALKDHFSRDATKDIESLFLISKSNCAFVNYRTEAACTAAMHRFHDSRFNGVRLVCRLRRSSAPASGIPTGPSAMVGSPTANPPPPKSPQNVDGVEEQEGPESPTRPTDEHARQASSAKERYFIVKSLTLQDLESSVRTGIWATQSHNEDALNKAYHTAENVYLIFSANKSGEYFGYARMASPILEDATSLLEFPPKKDVAEADDVPKSIPTPATEFAPKGRIIDDSARGTIFWEAELSESEGEGGDVVKQDSHAEVDPSGVAQGWGKPFKVEWISTNRLPFYRTRGLRNPWNANREVKIARDGTELETSVGERLVQMFHRLGPSSASVPLGGPILPPPSVGAPQMRPY
ncbi:uncharacterized protein EI97DRAFT_447115 [Westerdykella ornata]|uniref:YTH domain-containing protein n=1 Tax=Westerdykella ornata TaxID=318751 RepID=A0A6A6JXT8_WESOR|nr:uncharacterized protein EI97DRAFT_447115 [Westerdykella ornata]KAF2281014.1 hypothetical protein EI97DRAFT_447115 [Westerdykella ornata]